MANYFYYLEFTAALDIFLLAAIYRLFQTRWRVAEQTPRGRTLPIVGAERRCGQPGTIVEVAAGWVFCPGVADGDGVADLPLDTSTLSPSIFASAQTNFLSLPAIAN